MKESTIERLRRVGVFLHKSGFDYNPLLGAFDKRPLCAIWHKSEEPTEKEIGILTEIVQEKIDKFNPRAVEGFSIEGANTITFKKEDGKWTFRRLTWSMGPTWYPKPGSLEEIREEEIREHI